MPAVDAFAGADPSERSRLCSNSFKCSEKKRASKLRFVYSDMWRPYLDVIKQQAPQALNILDRFHIMKKFGEAIDQVRRQERAAFKKDGWDNLLENGR